MLRRFLLILLLGLMGLIAAACSTQAGSGVTPAPQGLTFLFFLTKG